jgi:hypothetical protein
MASVTNQRNITNDIEAYLKLCFLVFTAKTQDQQAEALALLGTLEEQMSPSDLLKARDSFQSFMDKKFKRRTD